MNINRNNYEECFLLYVDNELSAVEREAVEVFVSENADLRGELNLLQQLVVRADKKITFDNKAELLKSSAPANPVNESNYEEYFILYGDDELSNEEKDFVEQFVYRHPQHQSAFELLQGIRFTADTSIVFPDKQSLYRSEKDERVIVMRWWRIAAAAVVLFFIGGAAWYFSGTDTGTVVDPIAVKPATKTNEADTKNPLINTTPDKQEIAEAPKSTINNSQSDVKTSIKNDTQKKQKEVVDQPEVLIVYVDPETKKSDNSSNSSTSTNVTQKEETVTKVDENPNKSTASADITDEIVDLDEKFKKLSTNDAEKPMTASFASDEGQIVVLNTTVSNKSKMRGFFRKVGRVVDKATNIGPADESEDKKGIRIASFQIALK